jgi:hypothetical protein
VCTSAGRVGSDLTFVANRVLPRTTTEDGGAGVNMTRIKKTKRCTARSKTRTRVELRGRRRKTMMRVKKTMMRVKKKTTRTDTRGQQNSDQRRDA